MQISMLLTREFLNLCAVFNALQIQRSDEVMKRASHSKNTRYLAWKLWPVQQPWEKILLTPPNHRPEPPPSILDTALAAPALCASSPQVVRGDTSPHAHATCA